MEQPQPQGSATTKKLLPRPNSTIANNFSDQWGGGIYSRDSTLTRNKSTVSGNTVFGVGFGVGIFTEADTLSLTNSTVAGNEVFGSALGAGIFNRATTMSLSNSTVRGNSGFHDPLTRNPSFGGAIFLEID